MVAEEGTGNGEGADVLKRSESSNMVGVRLHPEFGDGGSGPSEGLQTYKRRKYGTSFPESNGFASVEPSSQLADQRNCRNVVLEQLYQSLSGDEGGVESCIHEALMLNPHINQPLKVKESDSHGQNGYLLSQTGTGYGTLYSAKDHIGVITDKPRNGSNNQIGTDMIQHAIFKMLTSEKFTALSKLLLENFRGTKVDELIDLSQIHLRMKEGIYERSPKLFPADIQQVWRKLQVVGTEMTSLAKSLADLSRTSFTEQVGDQLHSTFGEAKFERCTRQAEFIVKPERAEVCVFQNCMCRHCGQKADGRNSLVCDACEDMFHISCIEPAVSEIPPTNWYCHSCTTNGVGSPHENCVVCNRLNASRSQTINFSVANGTSTEYEENSYCSADEAHQSSEAEIHEPVCKICGHEVENSAPNIRVCEHIYCPNKYYHERCLTSKQLSSYGPLWYCPSCLCRVCLTDRDDDKIVLCDGCDHAYHIYCMDPQQTSIPSGKWFCRKCHAGIQEIRKARIAYEKKMKERDRMYGGDLGKRIAEEESDKGGREGMDMLLNAAKSLNSLEQNEG